MEGKDILTFAAGLAIGSVATWFIVKEHYRKISQEETEELREYYRKKLKSENEDDDEIYPKEHWNTNTECETYEEVVRDNGYSTESEQKGGAGHINADLIQIIPPDEFGDLEEYEVVSVMCYDDDVFEDDKFNLISKDEFDEKIGLEVLDELGMWEDDSIYIRNDEIKTYFEVIRDYRSYEDAQKCRSSCSVSG